VLTSGWHPDHVAEADRDCWPATCGASRTRTDGSPCRSPSRTDSLFDLSEPDVADQADELSALIPAIVAQRHQHSDTRADARDRRLARALRLGALLGATLNLLDRAASPLRDRTGLRPGRTQPVAVFLRLSAAKATSMSDLSVHTAH
jgi:hypothetical protein